MTLPDRALRIAVVAGEASGDHLGAGLIRSLRAGPVEVDVAGVAGPAMREAGCRTMLESSEFAVMGLAEIVRHLPRLWMLRRRLLSRLGEFRPDIFIGVDSPELNLGLAGRLKRRGVRTVQYVCPSIWAWRSGRARRIRRNCDRVLCLLPFEPALLREKGVEAVFVGHPIADRQAPERAGSLTPARRGDLLVALLPGSRNSEISRIGPPIARAAAWLAERRPGVRFSTAAASGHAREQFSAILRRFAPGVDVLQEPGNARDLLARADLAAAASGTVTMEAMVCGCPLVAVYRVVPLTAWIARVFRLLKTPHVALPNILAGRKVVPELLQEQVRGDTLGAELLGLYDDPGARDAMRAEFARLSESLGRGVDDRAAQAVLALAKAC
ncbi:MAG: lipid-A-disaccharide synthase [Gammaproteobacteria bacterium]|nr:lipid-A-disaccharide synthase [Gammaproteobacteria bacterium]